MVFVLFWVAFVFSQLRLTLLVLAFTAVLGLAAAALVDLIFAFACSLGATVRSGLNLDGNRVSRKYANRYMSRYIDYSTSATYVLGLSPLF